MDPVLVQYTASLDVKLNGLAPLDIATTRNAVRPVGIPNDAKLTDVREYAPTGEVTLVWKWKRTIEGAI